MDSVRVVLSKNNMMEDKKEVEEDFATEHRGTRSKVSRSA